MATITWSGGGADNNWSTPGNWDLGRVPAAGDNAVFNGTSGKNCTMDALGSFNGNITLDTGYTGTVTDSLTHNLGNGSLQVTSGTYDATLATIQDSKNLTLNGGTLKLPSGLFAVHNTVSMTSGTLVHNNGTLELAAQSTQNVSIGSFVLNKITFNQGGGTTNLNSGTFPMGANPTAGDGSGGTFNVNSGATLTGSGTLTVHASDKLVIANGGTLSGFTAITLQGNLTVATGSTVPNIPVTISGTSGTTIDHTGGGLGTFTFSKTNHGAGITVAGGTVSLGANPTSNNGTVTVQNGATLSGTGTLTMNNDSANNRDVLVLNSGATLSGFTEVDMNGNFKVNSGATVPAGLNVDMLGAGGGIATFDGGGKAYGTFTVNSSDDFSIASNNTFDYVVLEGGCTLKGIPGTTQTVNKGFTFENGNAIASTVPGSSHTWTSPTDITITASRSGSGSSIQDSVATSSNPDGTRWYAGHLCANVSGNSGWIFTDPVVPPEPQEPVGKAMGGFAGAHRVRKLGF